MKFTVYPPRWHEAISFIKNVWAFRREIADFSGCDYAESLNLLKRGLELQRDKSNKWLPQDACVYNKVIAAIDRVANKQSEMDFIDRLHKQYKIDHLEYSFDNRKLVTPADSLPPEQRKRYDKDFVRACKHEEYMQKQDAEYLGKLIGKHIRRLWI
jgi:hypothetical protein